MFDRLCQNGQRPDLRFRDPFISGKVRSLQIVFNAHAERSLVGFALRSRVRNTLLSHKLTQPHPLKMTFPNFVKGLIARVPTFTNVRGLTIDSWGLRQVDDSALSSLYKHLWEALENRLECLTLKGNLEDLERAISSAPTLSILRRLHIDFGQNINEIGSATAQKILVSVIAPFVKKMNAHLEALKIWCWASLDMSSFFDVCNSFPQLGYLAVRMAFDKALHEPSGLRALLWNSAETLQRLEMRLNPTQVYMNAGPEAQLGGWLLGCLNDERYLSQVRELDLYPSTTADGLVVILAGVGRASATLQRLIIRDRYVVPAEALEIIDALSACRGLRYLRMNILRLEIDIVDRMVARLPSLEGLWLSLGDQISTDNPTSLRVRICHSRYFQ